LDPTEGKAIEDIHELGYTNRLYVLAFDHRGSFQKKMLGIAGTPNEEETARIADAKKVIFEGFQQAIADGAPRKEAGLLVDEQFGADIARTAKQEGLTFAMPVERSGQDEFDFEYGDDGFAQHILEFDPTFSKVLVRYNPDGDRTTNATQLVKLKKLSHWLQEGAGVQGYVGFAIGRTIWWDALKAYLDGETDRQSAAKTISENYRRMIDVYSSASS